MAAADRAAFFQQRRFRFPAAPELPEHSARPGRGGHAGRRRAYPNIDPDHPAAKHPGGGDGGHAAILLHLE